MTGKSPFVVSAEWLADRLKDDRLSIVDGSWYLPAQNRDARSEYEAAHIPGAVFFDQDEVVEPGAGLPHSLPSPGAFARHAGAMGISRNDTIVAYDGLGIFSAPRVWWLFRAMGARDVFVLDGGFGSWQAGGFPVTSERTGIAPAKFDAKFDETAVAAFDAMRATVEAGSAQIADARPAGRFAGVDPEPREGMRRGHMPGARNIPAFDLSRDGFLLPLDDLRNTIETAGIDMRRPVVTTCGSGVAAAVISMALQSLGHTDNRLYDGSWSEWGGRDDTPVATGS